MQNVPYGNPENAQCDQHKVDLLEDYVEEEGWGRDEKIKGELRGSP